jgi:translation elongation factor P/translation initiation factor 5A
MYDGVVAEFNLLRLGSIRSRSPTSIASPDPTEAEKGLATQGARPGTSGSRNGLMSSGSSESPSLAIDHDAQRRRFEDEYRRRRASRASQRSQRTVLAELEGDLGPYGLECEDVVPPLPFASLHTIISGEEEEAYESILQTRNKTFVVRRKTMVGEGKTGVFVKGKMAATIVAVRSKPVPSSASGVTKVRIEEESDLDFCAVMDERFMIYDEDEDEDEETGRRNGGELKREVEEGKTVESEGGDLEELGDFEAVIVEAMKQTRLDDLRRERRRRKRSHLAKGGGSRDLGIVVPMPSK